MWTYHIVTGQLLAPNGLRIGSGYSGKGPGRNNPAMCPVADTGPSPVGKYQVGEAYADPHLGPCVMHLDPLPGTETFGRSLFRIHGDNADHDASHGCIILGPAARRAVAASHDHILEVME